MPLNQRYLSNVNGLIPSYFTYGFSFYTLFVIKTWAFKLERVCKISKTAFTIKINVLLLSYGEKSLLYFCNKTIIRFHGWIELWRLWTTEAWVLCIRICKTPQLDGLLYAAVYLYLWLREMELFGIAFYLGNHK